MGLSEFDSVAWTVLGELTSSSRSEEEAVPSCSRANVDCGTFSVAEVLNSDTCSVADDVDSNTCSVAKALDCVSPSVAE